MLWYYPSSLAEVARCPRTTWHRRVPGGESEKTASLPRRPGEEVVHLANVHSDLPLNIEGHHTEFAFARQLSAFDDEKLHLWFSLNYLPGTNDIDALIFHEEVGVFVVELKGVRLEQVVEYGLGRCVISGRSTTETPLQQALRAVHSLRNYLAGKSRRSLPFITATACWPRIRRFEWKRTWSKPDISNLSDSMLFEEDLSHGPDVLRARLKLIRDNPPIGKAAFFRHDPEVLKFFIENLTVTARPLPTPTELERLRQIEGRVRSGLRKEFPPSAQHQVAFKGHPGTGKTFCLLELGISYIQSGQDVLFVCFNKVLASDIRRLLSFSDTLDALPSKLEIADIFELVTPWGEQHGVSITEERDPDAWAELVVNNIRSENPQGIPRYGALLVDEAQDMPRWAWDFLSVFLQPNASVFIADGPGQELYGESPVWLNDFRTRAQPRRLNRNFRNTKPAFIVAQGYYEKACDPAAISSYVARFRGSGSVKASDGQLSLGFDRPEGLPPRMIRIDDSSIWTVPEDSPSFPDHQEAVMVRELKHVIREELEELKGDQYPIDFLVLVPDTKSSAKRWTKLALDGLGLDYLDYTDDKRRRDLPRRDQIRFCTYHSARGIEALRVLLIGFEQIESVANSVGASHKNLGYIVLSRALLTTTVVRTSSGSASVRFLDELVANVATM